MSLGINLLMYLTEITSKSLGNNFLSKVFENYVHHKKITQKRSPVWHSFNAWKRNSYWKK